VRAVTWFFCPALLNPAGPAFVQGTYLGLCPERRMRQEH